MKAENKDNLRYYNMLSNVPDEAKKTITGGKLNGMTDINPMWRIKAMTEAFGPCGIGWHYEIVKQWNETYGQVVKTYCNINLYVKVDDEWSMPIPGTGGSSFVSVTKNGADVSDENMKMALTDALSVAMKALGVGASVYWAKGCSFETKYESQRPVTHIANTSDSAGTAAETTGTDDLSVQDEIEFFVKPALAQCFTKADLKRLYESYPKLQGVPAYKEAFSARRKALGI